MDLINVNVFIHVGAFIVIVFCVLTQDLKKCKRESFLRTPPQCQDDVMNSTHVSVRDRSSCWDYAISSFACFWREFPLSHQSPLMPSSDTLSSSSPLTPGCYRWQQVLLAYKAQSVINEDDQDSFILKQYIKQILTFHWWLRFISGTPPHLIHGLMLFSLDYITAS